MQPAASTCIACTGNGELVQWRRMWPSRLAVCLTWFFVWCAATSAFAGGQVVLRSRSGQFIVRGAPLGASQFLGSSTSQVSYVRLDPSLLAVSCERIKEAVLEELGMMDSWRGSIAIALHPVQEDNEPIIVTSVRYKDRWGYRIHLPEQVNRTRLIKTMIQVLLMEIANRKVGAHQAELPPWLAEGLSEHLQKTILSTLTLEPATRLIRREKNPDPLKRAREYLRAHPPLTLNQLNLPDDDVWSDQKIELYQSCAHLFVHELLRLKKGRLCLQEMLARSPENLNWQTAFLLAFKAHFPHLIDVDKWWGLTLVNFTGRDLMSAWPLAESWRQIDGILTTSVEVRLRPNDLPLQTQVKLQSIISEWEYARQVPVLLQKLNHLQALRLRGSQELDGLVKEYRAALENYLQKRAKAGNNTTKGQLSSGVKILIADTRKRLDQLDLQREFLRQQTNPPAAPQFSGRP